MVLFSGNTFFISVVALIYLFGAVAFDGYMQAILDDEEKEDVKEAEYIFLLIAWPIIAVLMIIYGVRDLFAGHGNEEETVDPEIPAEEDSQMKIHFHCSYDRESECGKSKDICCHICPDKNACTAWHCDDYENCKHGYDCDFAVIDRIEMPLDEFAEIMGESGNE